jgi:hypothetical protein
MSLVKRKSKIQGIGIFTDNKIESKKVFYRIPLDKVYNQPHKKCAFIGKNRWVNDNLILNWINHSCIPNTILDVNSKIPKLIAKRNVNAGEEITVNYFLTELQGKLIDCNCGNKRCKGKFPVIR